MTGDENDTIADVASAESTGGAGPNYEARVAAVVLARMLLGDRVVGLDFPIERVLLQSRFAGHLLDDISIFGTDHYGAEQVIDYQSKRSISPVPSDKEFEETISRCLQAIQNDGDDGPMTSGHHRFGLVSNPSKALRDLTRLTEIARSHDRASSFVELVRHTCAKGVRDRLDALRKTVIKLLQDPDNPMEPQVAEAGVAHFTWRIAKAMHVWQAAAEPSGEAVREVINRLDHVVVGETRASAVWEALEVLAHEWAPRAGSISRDMLRRELENRGLALDHAPRYARAFRTLVEASRRVLNTDSVKLGRTLQLPRYGLRTQLVEETAAEAGMLLSGRPGVGKSSVAKLVAADLQARGNTVLGISLAGRSGSLSALEADLGVSLRDGLAGAPIGAPRVLVVDGAEQALTDAGHLLGSVLGAFPDHAEGPGWRLMLTARDEAAPTIARLLQDFGIPELARVSVGELSDEEVAQVVAAFPILDVVQRNPRAGALLLRRPYLVELLIRAAGLDGLPVELGGEEDLMAVVTRRLVRRDDGGLPGVGHPEDRSDTWLRMAEAAIAGALPVLLTGCDSQARQGLLSDDIIARTGQSLSFRFAHDVLLDYAVATRLSEPGGRELLGMAPPRPLVRPVRLWMQSRLAAACTEDNVVATWGSVLADAAALMSRDGARWRDVPYEALLHLGRARRALTDLTPILMADTGAGLAALIDVAERHGRLAEQTDMRGPIALDPALTGPVVELLGQLGSRVPPGCRAAALRLVHHHLAAAFAYRGSADAGIDNAGVLPAALMGWVGDDTYSDELGLCTGALGFLAEHLTAEAEAFLISHARQQPDVVAEPVESVGSAAALARRRPDLTLRLAGLFYLAEALDLQGPTGETTTPQARESSMMMAITGNPEDAAVRDHDVRQADHLDWWPIGNNQSHPTMGPFLALLDAHPAEGLRLVGAVVDVASAAHERIDTRHRPDEPPLRVTLRYGQPPTEREFRGTATVWCWHRRTTVGPGPACSALMALRQWASAQISNGASLAAVRDMILNAGTSLSFVAVAWFVMLEHFDQVDDQMDLLLVHPELWDLEIFRGRHESDLALDVPDMTRLTWTAGDVVMQLVLRADAKRRGQLAGLGRQLLDNVAGSELYDDVAARRWADVFDVDRYEARQLPNGVEVVVRHDAEVEKELAERAAPAVRALTAHALLRQAVAMRDGKTDLAGAEELWTRISGFLAESLDIGIHHPADLVAAAAAGVITAARAGVAVADANLHDAVEELLEAAAIVDGAAPPPRQSPPTEDGELVPGVLRDNVWPDGFDRSAAAALPVLMGEQTLAGRASVSAAQVAAALQQVAASPYTEARHRLSAGLLPLWQADCGQHPVAHEAIVATAIRIVRTAGYGPWDPLRGYAPATLPEPVEDFLAAARTDELVLDLDGAAHAIPLLAPAAGLSCPHAAQAQRLLDVLIGYDELVWPSYYVRRQTGHKSLWRSHIDQALAERILAGDDDCLPRRLAAFALKPEGLAPLLQQLQRAATDSDRAARLHAVWPTVLDALLPAARTRDDDAFFRDLEDLDNALVLVPEPHVDYWPWPQTVALAVRWRDAYPGHAELADRAILFALKVFGATEDAAQFVLPLLTGADPHWMKSSSQYAVWFLKLVLGKELSADTAAQLRSVLDALARIGDDVALNVQRELESS